MITLILIIVLEVFGYTQPSKTELSVNEQKIKQSVLNGSAPDTAISQLVVAGTQPQLVANNFSFTEGPATDKAGNIFFTDQPNNKIWKYSTDGKLSVFLDPAGRANGLAFDRKGNLLACADEQNQLWSISPKGKITVLVKDFQGHRLNGPNDLWVDNKGGIYFTDPYYQRDYWTRKSPDIPGQNVFYLPKGKKEPVIVASDLKQPNGIIGSADGKYLFVADIKANKTYKYLIAKDGSLQEKQLFIEQGSDGMTLDEKGNIYLTGKGVTIYNSAGSKIGNIPVPENWTGNVTFGGPDRKTLFITASKSVYVLPMQVKGINHLPK